MTTVAIKKKKNAIWSSMNGSKDCHTEGSKTNIRWCHLYVQSKKKNGTNELIYKTEMGSYSSKQNDGCPEESKDEEVE